MLMLFRAIIVDEVAKWREILLASEQYRRYLLDSGDQV
jgi:hypothetical protein